MPLRFVLNSKAHEFEISNDWGCSSVQFSFLAGSDLRSPDQAVKAREP